MSSSLADRDRSATERDILDIVARLLRELGGTAASRAPSLDDVLDRDLGISSLERVELLLRIEKAFGVRLADAVMANAQTVADLAAAVLAAAPAHAATEREHARLDQPVSATSAPADATTLVEVLRWHAERTPDRTHIYLRRDDDRDQPITYGALWTNAARVAAGLRDRGVTAGECVVVMLRTEEAFFTAFFGILLARAVPVPIYPPVRLDQLGEFVSRQRAIVANAGARVLITFTEAERLATLIRARVPSLTIVATVDSLSGADPETAGSSSGDDTALIQYTSGSTGSPKGVVLSHRNLLANIRAIGESGLGVERDDVCVSWLPLYHDMGLIGAWLTPLYYGVPLSIMSPLDFLSRPSRWLWAIHRFRGTVSPAPNFAYDLVARKVSDDELTGLDLGSWRLALNGSEMVSADTIDRFTTRMARYGFRPESMCPVYGLAECSVGLTMTPRGQLPRIDRIAREPFEQSRALIEANPADPHPLQFVSCGRPLANHAVRIVDASGRLLGDRQEGHVQFQGPSMTRGYFRNQDATNAIMIDGWIDTGDRGYWHKGDLFITGREKDVIIQGGRNISAPEVEELAASVPGIRRGCVAAFGLRDETIGTERLVVVAETRERDAARQEALRHAVVEAIATGLGAPPDVVAIVAPGTVLKTSSGKIRRAATRDAYVDGTLGQRKGGTGAWIALALDEAHRRARQTMSALHRIAFSARVVLAMAATVPGLWVILHVVPRGKAAGRVAQRWSRLMMKLCGVTLRVSGLEHLRGVESALLAANHASYLDPVVLMAALPVDLGFLAKRGLADYPVIGTVITRAGHVTIGRMDMSQKLAGADDLLARAAQHDLLVVFPEGTFDQRRRLLPFRLGAFRAAVETGRPIVPIAIRGTRDMLPDGAWIFTRGPIDVSIGAPIRPVAQGWPEMVRLRDLVRAEIAHGAGEPA